MVSRGKRDGEGWAIKLDIVNSIVISSMLTDDYDT